MLALEFTFDKTTIDGGLETGFSRYQPERADPGDFVVFKCSALSIHKKITIVRLRWVSSESRFPRIVGPRSHRWHFQKYIRKLLVLAIYKVLRVPFLTKQPNLEQKNNININ